MPCINRRSGFDLVRVDRYGTARAQWDECNYEIVIGMEVNGRCLLERDVHRCTLSVASVKLHNNVRDERTYLLSDLFGRHQWRNHN